MEHAEQEIFENPVSVILNLCRVPAYKNDGLILSKKEGGTWGINSVPERHHALISAALHAYRFNELITMDNDSARKYAVHMMNQIRNRIPPPICINCI